MTASYSGQEALRAIDQILLELDQAKEELLKRRETIAKDPSKYRFPDYWMSRAHNLLGNALAIVRQAREAMTS